MSTVDVLIAPDELPNSSHAPSGIALSRVIAIVVVACFFTAALGYFVGVGRPPADDSVDVGFYQDMTAHHEQAVQMALIELANGENSIVRGFAQEIVIFQQWEMGRMHERLLDWGVLVPRSDTAMAWMGMPVPRAAMPGLATEDQMAALRAAKGADADALFLDLMAEHHRGGAHMAAYAAANARDPDVRALAAKMERNQSVEINEFRQTAARLGFDVEIEPYQPS